MLTALAFRKAGVAAKVEVATDGDKAISALQNGAATSPPTCVLLDIKLPSKSGLEVLAWIRDQPDFGELIIVVLTNSDHVPDVSKARDLGANSYLVKPGTFEELVEMVKRIKGRWLLLNQLPEEPVSGEAHPSA